MKPLVSIVLPTFDRARFLEAALRSVDDQTFKDFELIVQDNASLVDVKSIVKNFPNFPIRLYRSEAPVGQTQNIVLGISRASSKYVAVLCDDDLWHPNFLSIMVAALEHRADCVLAFANHELIDDSASVLRLPTEKCNSYHGIHLLATGYYEPFERVATLFRAVCVFSGCVFRLNQIDLSAVPTNLATNLDTYIAFILARSGGTAYYTADCLFQVRQHAGAVTSKANIDPQGKLVRHKSLIVLWETMLKDPCARHKKYYYFRRAFHRLLLTIELAKQGQWREGFAQIVNGRGIIGLRSTIYFLYYLWYVKTIGLKRRVIP